VIDDDGVRILTDNDLDGSDTWAVERVKTDEADAFTWGTIVDQRDASGNILYLSQTNEGSYDTIEVFDVPGNEIWSRTLTFVDDEGDAPSSMMIMTTSMTSSMFRMLQCRVKNKPLMRHTSPHSEKDEYVLRGWAL